MWRNSLTEVYKLSVGKKLCRNPENLSVMGDSIFDGNISIGNVTPKVSLEIQTNDLCYHLHKQFLVKVGVIKTAHVRGPTCRRRHRRQWWRPTGRRPSRSPLP